MKRKAARSGLSKVRDEDRARRYEQMTPTERVRFLEKTYRFVAANKIRAQKGGR